jgi:hypothetical protein
VDNPQVEISEKIQAENYVEAIKLLQEHDYDEFLRSVWQMPDKPRDLPQDIPFVWQLNDDKWHALHQTLHAQQTVDEQNALVLVGLMLLVYIYILFSGLSLLFNDMLSVPIRFLGAFAPVFLFMLLYYIIQNAIETRRRRQFYSGETKKTS